ncbi:HNH endonuclease [Streptomyces sp. H27-C3]|uniref:HNH endonuclease n=1 Tax=Streptomyces sp. H27-C3 TaxID=3046305 RepID=UPI0024BA253C|nr:HNH endonuclease [Streptomyces sp. H27-C3]MDJ0463170.1 HNH endonuclease [Streptomyces sp. H27-C3]
MDTTSEFWSRVDRTEDCWTWTGGTRGNGYGTFWVDRKRYYAHRYSYFLTRGQMPTGVILHACDNPICVRPDHLSEGTQADNVIDMWAKGRGVPPPVHFGENHHHARLTEAVVLDIRRQYASGQYSQQKLAEEYGMGRASIGDIVRCHTWRHVGGPTPQRTAA